MNTTLQQRIEEAAKKMSHNKMAFWEDCDYSIKDIEEIIYDACKLTAVNVLQNQWVSVEEGLPERLENKNVFDYVFVSNKNWVDVFKYDFKNNNWLDYVNHTHWGITNWMPIPCLKGGEKWQN